METAAAAGEAAVEGAKPLSMNGYKVALTKTVVKRALLAAVGNRYWEEVDRHDQPRIQRAAGRPARARTLDGPLPPPAEQGDVRLHRRQRRPRRHETTTTPSTGA